MTSVGTKARKKQSSLSEKAAIPAVDPQLERALLSLENTCVRVMESNFAGGSRDTDLRYWQQKFNNIATPVSLALAEYKGPRRFHYHYRHRADDESVLHPVLEPSPTDMLALVCKDALRQCRSELVGIQDGAVVDMRNMLENALLSFLLKYKKAKADA